MNLGRAARALWCLRPNATFLNHGAFGATPRELLDHQSVWQRRIEAHPAAFFMDDLTDLVRGAATALARFVGAAPERLVLVENATSGINAVLASLPFAPGDRIVTTSHVYGAVRNALRHHAARTGAEVVEVPLPMPATGPEAVVAAIEAALARPTALVLVDHVTSPSALVLPVAAIVANCHARGVPVLVDGAHAAGMLDLDVTAVDADWYVGTCHKWLCAPKGAGFLVARDDAAAAPIHPTVISHAYGQGFVAEFAKVGTRDPSAWLCLDAAIAFHERLGGAGLRRRNVGLARAKGAAIAAALGTETGAPPGMVAAMATVRLPGNYPADWATAGAVRRALWDTARLDALVVPLGGTLWLRLSAFAYVDDADFDAVPEAVAAALAQLRRAVA